MSESGEAIGPSSLVSNESSSVAVPSSAPSGKSIDQKFQVLLSCVGKLPDQEIVDTALNLLVNGKFDLEGSFIIASGEALLGPVSNFTFLIGYQMISHKDI